MPSGHDRLRRFRSPLLLLLLLATLYGVRLYWQSVWALYLAYPLAALFAWGFAWHLCLYNATEYGGTLTDPARLRRARSRSFKMRATLVPVAVLSVYLFWP